MKTKTGLLGKVRMTARMIILIFAITVLIPEKHAFRQDSSVSASEPRRGSFNAMSFGYSFSINEIRPGKIFTPNGDGWNDYFEIRYSNPMDSIVNGKIYSVDGELTAYMKKDFINETLRWDGSDLNGNPAHSGIYIYQVEVRGGENLVLNGTIILAR